MKLQIKQMTLVNFKGIKQAKYQFEPDTTNIYGDNGTGKTTIVDAFNWCLFGKDSQGRSDFEIKTIGADGVVIPQLDHTVEAVLITSNGEQTFKRTLREMWQKKRGASQAEFTGNETVYYWNDVPLLAGAYKDKVSQIINEAMLKLISGPLYFNTILTWQQRREILFNMSAEIGDYTILQEITTPDNWDQIQELTLMLNQKKSLKEYQTQIASQKLIAKKEMETIPTRVDEATRQLQPMHNEAALQVLIEEQQAVIAQNNQARSNAIQAAETTNKAAMSLQTRKNEILREIQALQHADQAREQAASNAKLNYHREQDNKIKALIEDIKVLNHQIAAENGALSYANDKAEEYRIKWKATNERMFTLKDGDTKCNQCQQELPIEEADKIIYQLRTAHEKSKGLELAEIARLGRIENQIASEKQELISKMMQQLEADREELNDIQSKSKVLNEVLATTEKLKVLVATENNNEKIAALQAEHDGIIIPPTTKVDTTALDGSTNQAYGLISEYKQQLNENLKMKEIQKRIEELNQSEQKLAEQIAKLEATEFCLLAFNKRRIEVMEANVNNKFKQVKFKLFETQINGGEKECCEALVNTNGAWVPFSSSNTAGQINAGLDIINAICEYNQVTAPIFIDNRESTVRIIKTESQIINLYVCDKSVLSFGAPTDANGQKLN
jgi:DNA repair protein SbcC/Rad50